MQFARNFAMAFFKRKLSPVERLEIALNDKQVARQKLAIQSGAAETLLEEKRAEAGRLAIAGAADAQLAHAEAELRAVDEQAKTLRAALAEFDEQILATERALADATSQRERELAADEIEAMVAAIEQAIPKFSGGATALIESITKRRASVPEATRFSANVDAVQREILSAADLICWELRTLAVRTRAGNGNSGLPVVAEPAQPAASEIERQLIYTLNPLLWREGSEIRRIAAFTIVGLPKHLLPVALQHRHVDYLNARRVQTLMHVHGSGQAQDEPSEDDPQLVDLDVLAGARGESAQADVA
jgi:hypothetical protein